MGILATIERSWAGIGLALVSMAPGATSQAETTYHTLTSEDGLSQNTVQCMIQDRRGFLVFGTKQGLNYYDGSRFELVRHDATAPDSIGAISIWTMAEDRDGKLWIGSPSGLDHFDPATGKDVRKKDVIRLVSEDSHVFTRYVPGDSGETKGMEIVYTRM